MRVRIQQLGDGLALILPPPIGEQSGFVPGAEVDVTVEDGAIVARPAGRPRYTLDELVAQITDENRHPEIDAGPLVGREEW